jgi:type II secretory pathway predicted ATPase ExeA
MSISGTAIMNNVLSTTVKFPQYQKAIEEFKLIFEFTEVYGKASGLFIAGSSGSGKSKLAERMVSLYPPVEEAERTQMKVIYFSMPAMPSLKEVCKALLDKLGQRYSTRADQGDLTRQLKAILKQIGTVVLIIDEAQHLIERRKYGKDIAAVADWIKQLINDNNISIVLTGMSSIEKLNIHNAQLRRRFKYIELSDFNLNTKADTAIYAGIVAKLIAESGFEGDTTCLRQRSSLEMLHYASNGRIAYIAKILAYALKIATVNNSVELTIEHLSQAYTDEIFTKATAQLNPFSGKFSPRNLDRNGEPFYEEAA